MRVVCRPWRQRSAKLAGRMVSTAMRVELHHSMNLRQDSSRGQSSWPACCRLLIARSRKFFLDQHVIRVVGGDGEDRDAVVGERFDERKQDSGLRERERAFELEADPAVRGLHIRGKVVRRADDGEFVGGAGDRGEVAFRGPVGDGSAGSEADDGVAAGEPAEFELVTGTIFAFIVSGMQVSSTSGTASLDRTPGGCPYTAQLLAFDWLCFTRCSGQQAGGIQRGQRRRFRRHQQRNFGAAEHDRVAAFVFQRPDHFHVICQRARQELGIDQFVHDDLVDARALLGAGNAVVDAGGFQRLADRPGLPSGNACRARLGA